MSLDKLIVIIFGASGIVFTYWFFLMKRDKEVKVSDSINIIVDGGYSPETISIPINKTTKLNFIRKDSNPCLEEVVFPDFKIKKFLPLNQKVVVSISPRKAGEYTYSCGMSMFHGKIFVKEYE